MSYSKRPFEIKGDLINKRSRIKELINIESNSRDDRICYEIAEILKEISILFRYYGTGQLEEISKFFGFQKLEPGDTVTIEDFSFFIVHFGRVAIYEQGSKTKEFVQDCHFGY